MSLPPCEAKRHGDIEEQGQVWGQSTGRESVQSAKELNVQPAGVALIGEGGVRKAVAQHHRSFFEGRLDDMGYMLAAAGQDQEGLALRRDRFDRWAKKEFPYPLGKGGPPWFPGLHHAVAVLTKELRQPDKLGRFAASFDPFEGDQEALATPQFPSHFLLRDPPEVWQR